MRWFKHDSDAHASAKLQKVLIKYGAQGYGLYWYCLECIAGNISEHNLTFELEHDAEILAYQCKMAPELVEEVITYMVGLGLFENRDGTITCMKMARRLDKSMTSNPEMRRLIAKAKNHDSVMTNPDSVMTNHDSVMTNPGFIMQDKIRLDKKRKEKVNQKEKWKLPDGVDPKAWAEFEQHRRDIGKPLKPLSRTKNANILKDLPPAVQRSTVDTTIANRWTGLFSPKQNCMAKKQLTTAENVAEAYQEKFGKPPPVGASTEQVIQMIQRAR